MQKASRITTPTRITDDSPHTCSSSSKPSIPLIQSISYYITVLAVSLKKYPRSYYITLLAVLWRDSQDFIPAAASVVVAVSVFPTNLRRAGGLTHPHHPADSYRDFVELPHGGDHDSFYKPNQQRPGRHQAVNQDSRLQRDQVRIGLS